jgi:4-methylaminobutanoate oxidase (formaldehyde-forming)
MNALRTEKGYRHWGHDIGIEDTPLEAGLAFCVAWDKPGGFIGQEALSRVRDAGPPGRRLVQLRLADPGLLLHHEEPIWSGEQIVGSVTSGMYGHRIEASLGMGYVRADHEPVTETWLAANPLEVEIAWRRVPVQAQLQPWYDPRNLRIKA